MSTNVWILWFIWKAFNLPEEETAAEAELTIPTGNDVKLPSTAEVEAQRERRRRFDEEWSGVSEVLSSVPLEPLVVNVSTKPDDDESAQLLPRTSTEMTDEIVEQLSSMFNFQ